jgi:hypothetical protein
MSGGIVGGPATLPRCAFPHFLPAAMSSSSLYLMAKKALLRLRPKLPGVANDAVAADTWVKEFSELLVSLCFECRVPV